METEKLRHIEPAMHYDRYLLWSDKTTPDEYVPEEGLRLLHWILP